MRLGATLHHRFRKYPIAAVSWSRLPSSGKSILGGATDRRQPDQKTAIIKT
jgi:hypothetical protein